MNQEFYEELGKIKTGQDLSSLMDRICNQTERLMVEDYLPEYSSSSEEEIPNKNLHPKIEEFSDEEMKPNPREEQPSSSGYRPHPAEHYQSPESSDSDLPGVNLFPKRRGKYKTIGKKHRNRRYGKQEYIPKYKSEKGTQDGHLNLDCLKNRDEEIDGWTRYMRLIVTTKTDKFDSYEALDRYLEHNMSGIVRDWWQSNEAKGWLNEAAQAAKQSGSSNAEQYQMYLDILGRAFRNKFIGVNDINNQAAVIAKQQEKASYILNNIKVCDMCYFQEFVCEYEKWFFKTDEASRPSYAVQFFDRLPPFWAQEAKKKWENKPAHIYDDLSGRIRLIEEMMEEQCKIQEFQKQSFYNNKPCCDQEVIDIPGQWGCGSRSYSKPRKKYSKRRKRYFRKVYPKGRKKYSKRYFRRRRPYKRNYRKKYYPLQDKTDNKEKKSEHCPQGKKNCKCWICKEEGHYANECPNKQKKQEYNKIIEVAYAMKLECLESDFSETESLYEYVSETESESSIESSDED